MNELVMYNNEKIRVNSGFLGTLFILSGIAFVIYKDKYIEIPLPKKNS